MERLLTIDELSDKLRVGKSTIYRWVHYDYIPHVKLGSSVRFSESAVNKWLKARESKGRNRLIVEIIPRDQNGIISKQKRKNSEEN